MSTVSTRNIHIDIGSDGVYFVWVRQWDELDTNGMCILFGRSIFNIDRSMSNVSE